MSDPVSSYRLLLLKAEGALDDVYPLCLGLLLVYPGLLPLSFTMVYGWKDNNFSSKSIKDIRGVPLRCTRTPFCPKGLDGCPRHRNTPHFWTHGLELVIRCDLVPKQCSGFYPLCAPSFVRSMANIRLGSCHLKQCFAQAGL